MAAPVDASGRRFGRLLAVERAGRSPTGNTTLYRCVCDCGAEGTFRYNNLQSGITKSCGCLKREDLRVRKTKPLLDVIVRQITSYYKRNATLRGIEWHLSDDDVRRLIAQPCHYCGEIGVNRTGTSWSRKSAAEGRELRNNGIDRVDNAGPYTVENTVPCCKHCNLAKLAMSRDEFLAWIKKVHDHNF